MDPRSYRPAGTDTLRLAAEIEARTAAPDDGTVVAEPTEANATASIVLSSPGAGYRWVVEHLWAYYTGGVPSAQALTVESPPSTVLLRHPMGGSADVVREIGGPIYGAVGQALRIVLPPAGAAVFGRLYASVAKVREAAV
jgi:hypothetical protein